MSHVDTAEPYRERLSPSLWVLAAAGGAAPMVALVFAPVDTTLALVVGALAGVALIALLVLASPVLDVSDGRLRAGRARIDVTLLGAPQVLSDEAARLARGQDLDPRCWHVIRGGIDGIVTIPVLDPDDPAPAWVLSSRTPDRLAAAVRRAQVRRSTPSR
ncbi:DUF3093 domain-containing protein [Microbacter sp. GSS18]|nr:DUF3093 domain-containing protein [Microbacter sp. GSS18]